MSNAGIPGLWRRYRSLPRNVFAIGFVSLLNDASSEIIYPLLPIFLTMSLGASARAIGVIEGLAESISSLLKLFAGYLSDRLGKRKALVVAGYSLASFARPLLAFTQTWTQVLAIRLTDRIGKGIRTAPRDAMIADTVKLEQRGIAFGFHRAMDHGGAVIGPLVGYLLVVIFVANARMPTTAEFSKIFIVASIPAVLAVLVAVFFMRETARRVSDGAETPKLSLRGFDSNFKRFLVVLALFTLSNSSDSFLILRAMDAGVSTSRWCLCLGCAPRHEGLEFVIRRRSLGSSRTQAFDSFGLGVVCGRLCGVCICHQRSLTLDPVFDLRYLFRFGGRSGEGARCRSRASRTTRNSVRLVQSRVWHHGVSCVAFDGYDLGLERTDDSFSSQRGDGSHRRNLAIDFCQASSAADASRKPEWGFVK